MSTVTIYTIKDGNAYQLGLPAAQALYMPKGQSWEWVTAAEYALPDGCHVDADADGLPYISHDLYGWCPLYGSNDDTPVLLIMDGGNYNNNAERVPLTKVRDIDPLNEEV